MVVAWVGWVIFSAQFERKAAEYDLRQLSKMEAASLIMDRNGAQIGKIFIQNRNPVALYDISPFMVKAVIAAEDNKFYEHDGVDYMGILRAAIANYRNGRISQGASTVTQQVARNSFELRERTYKRKFAEMFLANRIEKNFSKDQIMEFYLNRVYFGSGFYGVDAAARGYFGRPAKDLDAGQAAMLAGLLKSPQALSPWNNKEAATQARDFVLRRMRELRFIKREQHDDFVQRPLLVQKRTNPFKVSYAMDVIRQQAIAALGFDRAMNGGFRIETTLDSGMQRAAESSVREVLARVEKTPGYKHITFDAYRGFSKTIEEQINAGNMAIKMPEPKYLQGAVVALENSSGAILALVGGRDFKHSEYNRATQAKRPLGTAFTPFVFAAAYQKGIFPGEIVEDACLDNRFVMVGGDSGILGEWGVERADNEYEGPMTTREALAKGKNAATVRLGLQIGVDPVKKVSEAAGIGSPLRDYANAFLGSSEASLDEATLAYTVFPNGGLRAKQPFIIRRISDPEGRTVFQSKADMVPALSPEAAFQVNAGLQDALRYGTGAPAYGELELKEMPAGGKTGTAYGFTDTYFFGYNSAVTCGVWVGFDRPTTIFRGAFGKDLALPIWVKVMNVATQDFPAVAFPKPETLKPVEICRTSGLLATPQCPRISGRPMSYTEWATDVQLPTTKCDVHGGGIRNYAKDYGHAEWPRAVAAVDLTTIRPVAVQAPTLLGLSDVYGSVRPDAQEFMDSIPVARAIPVNAADDPSAPVQSAAPAPVASVVPTDLMPPAEPEIRRAEPVNPLDGALDTPAIPAPVPEPINF